MFFRYAAYKVGQQKKFMDPNFDPITSPMSIPNLQSLMERIDILFIYKIITNSTDCPELLIKFKFYYSLKLLKHNIYYFYMNEDIDFLSPIERMYKLQNNNINWLDYTVPVKIQ